MLLFGWAPKDFVESSVSEDYRGPQRISEVLCSPPEQSIIQNRQERIQKVTYQNLSLILLPFDELFSPKRQPIQKQPDLVSKK